MCRDKGCGDLLFEKLERGRRVTPTAQCFSGDISVDRGFISPHGQGRLRARSTISYRVIEVTSAQHHQPCAEPEEDSEREQEDGPEGEPVPIGDDKIKEALSP